LLPDKRRWPYRQAPGLRASRGVAEAWF
jgi:hypothetical protein